MKRHLLLLLISLFSLPVLLIAQTLHQDESFTLNTEITGSHIFEARDFVKMEPGFHYQANGTETYRAKTNPFLVFPPEGGETGGPDPDDNGVVGTMHADAGVSNSGGATYHLPIDLPKGIGGLMPDISLNYNSFNNRDGALGVGWSIDGISMIERTATNLYNDGFIDGINFNGNDKYSLDGQRLIAIEGEYGNDMTEYRTERETFAKIISYNSDESNDPDYFKVYAKNGKIFHYGNTNDSRIEGQNILPNFLYCYANKIADRNGNEINYTYYEEGGKGLIKKISYSNVEVTFNYANREQQNDVYIYGNLVELDKRLSSIKITVNNIIYKKYEFSYNSNGTKLRMENIVMYGKNGNMHFNSTTFEWGTEQNDFTVNTTNISNPDFSSEKTFGDFNGDGKTDIVHMYYSYDNNGNKVYENWSVNYSQNDGITFNEIEMGSLNSNPNFLPGGDLNADDMSDLIKITPENEYTNKIEFLFSTGDNFTVGATKLINKGEYFRIGDFNGNGRMELLNVRKTGDENNTANILESWEYNGNYIHKVLMYYFYRPNTTLNQIEIGDFTADGKTDLLINTTNDSTGIYEYDGAESLSLVYETGFPTKWHRLRVGDFNGDGITDLLTFAYTNPDHDWALHYFNGKDEWVTGNCPLHASVDPDESISDDVYQVADFNGDGKDDILEVYFDWDVPQGTWYNIYYSKGKNFIKEENYYDDLDLMPWYDNINSNFDFNGDSKKDCFIDVAGHNDPKKIIFFHKNEQSNLVHNINNPHNIESNFFYETLSKGEFYTKQENASWPVTDIQPAWYVCHQMRKDDGIGGQRITNYQFEGAKVHNKGKGFLGFAKTTRIDENTGRKVEQEYDYNSTYYYTFPKEKRVYSGSNVIQEKTYTNAVEHFGDKRIFPYTEKILKKEFDLQGDIKRTIRKQKHYSNADISYGNVTGKQVWHDKQELELDSDNFDYSKKTEYIYKDADIENWNIGLVTSKTTTKTSPDDNSDDIHVQKYSYNDGFNPRLNKTWNEPPQGYAHLMVIKEFNKYDEYGNVTKKTVKVPNDANIAATVTEYEYGGDYNHRFLTKKWQEENGKTFAEEYTYYPVIGRKKTETNINGLVTEYYYDSFGRLEKKVNPDQVVNVNVLRWVDAEDEDTPPKSLYYTWSQTSGQDEKKVYYDFLGRELRIVDHMFDGSKRYKDIEYNNLGKKKKQSQPYAANATPLWISYQYDALQRPSYIDKPNSEIEYTYDGRSTTKKNITTGQFITKDKNALGKVSKVTKNSGTVDYTYYSSGLKKNVVTYDNTLHYEYNPNGNKILMDDPDAGQYHYVYNALGQLIEKETPKGDIKSYEYDNLGRMTQKDCEDGTIEYVYDESANGLGKLSSVTAYNGTSKEYKYDDLSRIKKIIEKITSKAFEITYDYDIFGRQNKVTYPSGFSVTNKLDGNGYTVNTRISSREKEIFEALDYNEFDQLEKFERGNGKSTMKEYDQYGYPDNFITEGIMEQDYTFNYAWKNLSNRTNLIPASDIGESFHYDQNDRLIRSQNIGSRSYKAGLFKRGEYSP